MSAKTKIVVLHMKELIYTAIFAGLGVLVIVLLWWMFSPKEEVKDTSSQATYVPGVYTSSIEFSDQTIEVEVIVDENHINDISFVNLEESVATMYPLMQPTMDTISRQICKEQSLENITGEANSQYTTEVLLTAIEKALDKAKVKSDM